MATATADSAISSAAQHLLDQFHAARRAGVPIVAVQTADQFATLEALALSVHTPDSKNAQAKEYGVLMHDVIHGLRPYLEKHEISIETRQKVGIEPLASKNPIEVLVAAENNLPRQSMLFMLNAHRHFVESPTRMVQAVANAREQFKKNKRMLVLLAPSFTPPKELEHDIVVLDMPLPTGDVLRNIITRQLDNGKKALPDARVLDNAVAACAGLSDFAAEQIVAMSISEVAKGETATLWERKRVMIRQTPGLSVWSGGERFETIGGLDNIKRFLRRLGDGPNCPSGIVFIDEIEKDTAGMKGDNTGIAQKQHKALLTFMQDKGCRGILLDGQPGSGKTTIAKAFGNEINVPTIVLNLGDVQGSLVGQSEELMRNALKTIEAVCQGRILFIATCNDVSALSAELRGRFKNGHFFFDLPTDEERETIWQLYRGKYKIKAAEKQPRSEGWVGREIEACCDQAYSLGCTLVDASEYIVPQGVAMKDKVDARRQAADGRVISASYEGKYTVKKSTALGSGREVEG